MRSRLRDVAERAIIVSGIERMVRKHRDGQVLILAYHNVIPRGMDRSGDASLHLGQDDFLRQLDLLEKSCDVVALPSLLQQAAAGRQRIAITFDDAYAGALNVAVPELARRGMPATIFVAPALLGTVPWWDILADPATGIVPEAIRANALDSLCGKRDVILACARGTAKAGEAEADIALPRIGTVDDLTAAARYPGITFGVHTMSHPNLAAISGDELEIELVRPLNWLRDRFSCVVPWLSYPYGRFNQTTRKAAGDAGFVAALRIDGGWFDQADIHNFRHAIPRLNVPAGVSSNGFRLRMAGLGRSE